MSRQPDSHPASSTSVTRRQWLQVGALAPLGLASPRLLRARDRSPHRPRARACIVVFLFGAPAHQDVWDLKPNARAEYRGEFRPIATSVPGILVGEHVPRIAQLAHRFALVRSVAHLDNTHTVAMHHVLTGVRHAQPASNPQNQPGDFPCFGAVLRHLRDGAAESLPAGISLNAPANQTSANNHVFPGFFAGFLGRSHDPLFVSDDPSAANFAPFPNVEGDQASRLRARRAFLSSLEQNNRVVDRVAAVRNQDRYHQKAFDLITSPQARRAFDLTQESDRTRDRYGRNHFGQAMLLARRLVEAGCGFVTVTTNFAWDMHADGNNPAVKEGMNFSGTVFDHAVSVFLDDLRDRGLDDKVLFVATGEMGRTPKLQADGGRNHWPHSAPLLLAGGGLPMGQVIGQTTRDGGRPATEPVTVESLHATILHTLLDVGQLRISHNHLRDVINVVTAADPIPGLTL